MLGCLSIEPNRLWLVVDPLFIGYDVLYMTKIDGAKGKYEKRWILITGASTGIGEACALYLDKLGFNVFAGVRKESDAHSLKQKASKKLTPV